MIALSSSDIDRIKLQNRYKKEINALKKANEVLMEAVEEGEWLLSQSCKDTVFFQETASYRKRRAKFLKSKIRQKAMEILGVGGE